MAKYTKAELRELEQSDPRNTVVDPPCTHCVHLIEIGLQEGPQPEALTGWLCKAFPEGIWKAILRRQMSHEKVLLGQQGDKVFESEVIEFYDGPDTVSFNGEWVSNQLSQARKNADDTSRKETFTR